MPDLPQNIWSEDPLLGPGSLDEVRRQARARAEALDWSRIEPGRMVNLLANPHGFQLCGMAYVTMLEEIADHVRTTRGAKVRLRIAESMGHIENPDWVKIYDLKARFGDVEECPQMGAGTKVDTKLGDMYVQKTQVNLVQLHLILSNKFRVNTNLPVYISGDKDATHGSVIRVLDIVRQEGIQKVSFAITPAPENK